MNYPEITLDYETINKSFVNSEKYIRLSAKAIIKDKSKIILTKIRSNKEDIYKLPGGGVKENESVLQALSREVLEETGYMIKNVKNFGVTLDYVEEWKLIQLTYFFITDLANSHCKMPPQITKLESLQKLTMSWFELKDAINLIKNLPESIYSNHIKRRDLEILIKYEREYS